ncbi:hypothetical protein B0H19DRAFT_1074177 [Mycena capillaripes]|nr:hypothetical protein B0H19DRAFT_1074177 [Mycena capillaripes]
MPRRFKPQPPVAMSGIPDFRDGIGEWNAAWEAQFPRFDSRLGNLAIVLSSPGPSISAQEQLRGHYDHIRSLCVHQNQMRVAAVTTVLQPDSCWKKVTPAARETHMLEGLRRTCSIEPVYMPSGRALTSDITLASLETGNGEGFLSLLKRYLPDGEVSVVDSGYISYPHPGWTFEAIQRLDSEPAARVQILIAIRDEFITPEVVLKSNLIASTPLDRVMHRLTHMCDGCIVPEGDGIRLLACKNCNNTMSRKVFNCSRQCQRSEWPNHKKICGKEVTPLDVQNVTLPSEGSLGEAVFFLRRIGPVQNGYKRSPALLRQMQYLDACPSDDYVFFSPTGPYQFRLPIFLLRLVFRLSVQTAMATGDVQCIRAICELLPNDQDAQTVFSELLVEECGGALPPSNHGSGAGTDREARLMHNRSLEHRIRGI